MFTLTPCRTRDRLDNQGFVCLYDRQSSSISTILSHSRTSRIRFTVHVLNEVGARDSMQSYLETTGQRELLLETFPHFSKCARADLVRN